MVSQKTKFLKYLQPLAITVLLSTFLFLNGSAQLKDDCISVQEIEIPFNSKEITHNTNEEDAYNYNLIYYTDEDEYSFWYKLNITENCDLKFSVLPSNETDEYDFMIYKFSKLSFCEAVVNNKVSPLNTTEYEFEKKVNTNHTLLPNQKTIQVKKGENYYISIVNIIGEDCGHRLFIDACDNSVILNAVKKPCFKFYQPHELSTNLNSPNLNNTAEKTHDKLTNNEQLNNKLPKSNTIANPSNKDNLKIDENIDNTATSDIIIVEDSVLVSGFVRDNDNSHKIDALISFEDDVTGEIISFHANANDGYKISLERSRSYKLTCSSLGYYSITGMIEFLKPSVYDFYLLKIKEGSSFITENINFYPNTYALKEESFIELDALANYLKRNPDLVIEVEGHTADNIPINSPNPEYLFLGQEWNFLGSKVDLSLHRAESVQHYLFTQGIAKNRVTIKGYGDKYKLDDSTTSNITSNINERIEIKIIQRDVPKNLEHHHQSPN